MKKAYFVVFSFAVASSCMRMKDEAPASAPPAAPAAQEELAMGGPRGGDFAADEMEEGRMSIKLQAAKPKQAPAKERSLAGIVEPVEAPPAPEIDGAEGGTEPAPTRSWFPESFLFAPALVTDEGGNGAIAVTIPDRLTTWRVLALAHTRQGQQAGAVTEMLGTLPVYVEPVVPRFLYSGDEARIPVQVVNTTEKIVSKTLVVSVENGVLGSPGSRVVTLQPGASAVEPFVVRASKTGDLVLTAKLADADAIERRIEVRPRGRLERIEKSGTLAAPRVLSLIGPADLDRDSAEVELTVYPGALSILRSELGAALGRGGAAEDAYALLLAGRARELITALGADVDEKELRNLRILATQRAIRHAYVATPEVATLLAEGALAHPNEEILKRLGDRLVAQLAASQRPDGTFGGATHGGASGARSEPSASEGGRPNSLRAGTAVWTLQRLLVATSEALRAVEAGATDSAGKQRSAGARIRANAAFERNIGRVEDAYTAAAILAGGGVSGSLADQLRKRVREAIKTNEDGSRYLPVDEGVVRSDGSIPSVVEATAIAALALEGDKEAPWIADLGATVLGGYRYHGWGDGRTNLWCLRAVTAIFRDPVPDRVKITATIDGAPLAEGVLDAKQLKDVLRLRAPASGAAGEHRYEVRADPAVPGLGFTLALAAYVPWRAEPEQGLALAVEPSSERRVGRPIDLTLIASAPAGRTLKISARLPAGVAPDTAQLDQLVAAGTITRYETEEGLIEVWSPVLAPGQPFQTSVRVVPTLAGALATGPMEVAITDSAEVFVVPPAVWRITP